MRYLITLLALLAGTVFSAAAQVSIGIGLPNVNIGIHVPVYPRLVPVPGSPVYYAPGLNLNFFFYDGMHWVYQNDNWYASSWYNGPWSLVTPEAVPLYLLQTPVRYYRSPPPYFKGWQRDAAPRWGEHWGPAWGERRPDWGPGHRPAYVSPAPLPSYQRGYSGSHYPHEQQQQLHEQHYPYSPVEPVVRQHYQEQRSKQESAPKPEQRPSMEGPQERRGPRGRD